MWFRLRRSEYEQKKGARNKRALKKLVLSGEPPGLIAYFKGEPIAWCALAPREQYSVLGRSRVLAPVDDCPVWSIVCLFIAKPYRRRGVSAGMLEGAARYARKRGARILEGYPIEPKQKRMPDVFAMTGLASAFSKAGFSEVARRSRTRPIMRRMLRRGR
jgi:GNAT superfamily N-acetyltransferase